MLYLPTELPPCCLLVKVVYTVLAALGDSTCSCLLSFFSFLFCKYFIVPCENFGSPDPGKAQQLQEQCYPLLSVCAVFSCVQTVVTGTAARAARAVLPIAISVCSIFLCPDSGNWYGCQGLGFVMCVQMLMHTVAHMGCMDTILRESAPKVDSGGEISMLHQEGFEPGRKIIHRTRGLKLMSVLCLGFPMDVIPAELCLPLPCHHQKRYRWSLPYCAYLFMLFL